MVEPHRPVPTIMIGLVIFIICRFVTPYDPSYLGRDRAPPVLGENIQVLVSTIHAPRPSRRSCTFSRPGACGARLTGTTWTGSGWPRPLDLEDCVGQSTTARSERGPLDGPARGSLHCHRNTVASPQHGAPRQRVEPGGCAAHHGSLGTARTVLQRKNVLAGAPGLRICRRRAAPV